MGIELYWDDDAQTTLLCEFQGRWSWDELFRTLLTVKKITDGAAHEISAILDLRASEYIPGGALFSSANMENARKIMQMGAGGTGPMMIVGANNAVRTIYSMMAGLNPAAVRNIHFADSMKQARARLAAPPAQAVS